MKRINCSTSAKGRKKIATTKQKYVNTEPENNRTKWKQVRFLSALAAPSAMGDSDDEMLERKQKAASGIT